MASTPPNPASRSDADPEIPLGVRVQRQRATGPAGQPGTIRVVAIEGDTTRESEGAAALATAPRAAPRPRCRGLGRPRRSDPDPGPADRRGARSPPADRRGRAGGQPAGQDRDDRGRRPHRPLPPELRRAGRRIRARHRARPGLPADRPQRRLGPADRAPPGQWRGADPQARPGPPAVGDRRRPHRRLFPVRRPDRRRHRRRPGPGHPQGDPGHGRAAVQAQARADPGPPRDQPGARGLQPADEPRREADRPRRDHLLPRHLRPRHPPDRRARQLPRARVGDARRLPDPGQQQPVGDHEAADRGDGHPRRDRGGRRDLRHERGRQRR